MQNETDPIARAMLRIVGDRLWLALGHDCRVPGVRAGSWIDYRDVAMSRREGCVVTVKAPSRRRPVGGWSTF